MGPNLHLLLNMVSNDMRITICKLGIHKWVRLWPARPGYRFCFHCAKAQMQVDSYLSGGSSFETLDSVEDLVRRFRAIRHYDIMGYKHG